MNTEERGDSSRKLEESYKDYTVYDQHYEKIGKVADLFVDNDDQPEYIGIKQGLLGTKSTLIPMEIARINDKRELIEIASDKDTIENAPTFSSDKDVDSNYESQIHQHFGLERPGSWNDRGSYGGYYDSNEGDRTYESPVGAVDTEYGERRDQSEPMGDELYGSSSSTGSSQRDLDIPLEGSERESSDEAERRESSRDSSVTFGGPDDRDTSTSESQESGGTRVYKRVRR